MTIASAYAASCESNVHTYFNARNKERLTDVIPTPMFLCVNPAFDVKESDGLATVRSFVCREPARPRCEAIVPENIFTVAHATMHRLLFIILRKSDF
jgi:hypothetical protein